MSIELCILIDIEFYLFLLISKLISLLISLSLFMYLLHIYANPSVHIFLFKCMNILTNSLCF